MSLTNLNYIPFTMDYVNELSDPSQLVGKFFIRPMYSRIIDSNHKYVNLKKYSFTSSDKSAHLNNLDDILEDHCVLINDDLDDKDINEAIDIILNPTDSYKEIYNYMLCNKTTNFYFAKFVIKLLNNPISEHFPKFVLNKIDKLEPKFSLSCSFTQYADFIIYGPSAINYYGKLAKKILILR